MGTEREKGVVVLCSDGGCCPTVDFIIPGKVIIQDDFGGSVSLTFEQWEDLKIKFAVRDE